MAGRHWFEISDTGWRDQAGHRPLHRLLLEAVQNAFDERVTQLSIELETDGIAIEDDGVRGFEDERLVYTVFLSDKREDPTRRGRMGRGLKELIAAMDAAIVETVGTTIAFGEEGRTRSANERTRGTRLHLKRSFERKELDVARAMLRLCIPPKGVTFRIDGRSYRKPPKALSLSSCELETVTIEDGVERMATRHTDLSLYVPRRGEQPHLLEMGIPIEPWDVPLHVDVGQRIPLTEGREGAPDRYRLALKATLLEAMIHRYMDARDLRAEWVHEVIARWPLRESVLDAYVSRAFPRGAVLGGTAHANDRARQIGAHVVDAATISHGAYLSLSRVLETAEEYVRRRSSEFEGESVTPDETHRRFATSVQWLARKIAGQIVRVRFFACDPNDEGLLEDARTDSEERVLSFNVRGPLEFCDLIEPATLGVVLHELAHLETPEHDQRFIDRLQLLAGRATRLLAEGGPDLADRLRRGEPDQPSASRVAKVDRSS